MSGRIKHCSHVYLEFSLWKVFNYEFILFNRYRPPRLSLPKWALVLCVFQAIWPCHVSCLNLVAKLDIIFTCLFNICKICSAVTWYFMSFLFSWLVLLKPGQLHWSQRSSFWFHWFLLSILFMLLWILFPFLYFLICSSFFLVS